MSSAAIFCQKTGKKDICFSSTVLCVLGILTAFWLVSAVRTIFACVVPRISESKKVNRRNIQQIAHTIARANSS